MACDEWIQMTGLWMRREPRLSCACALPARPSSPRQAYLLAAGRTQWRSRGSTAAAERRGRRECAATTSSSCFASDAMIGPQARRLLANPCRPAPSFALKAAAAVGVRPRMESERGNSAVSRNRCRRRVVLLLLRRPSPPLLCCCRESEDRRQRANHMSARGASRGRRRWSPLVVFGSCTI
jgi:hypothetical protein